MTRIKDLPTFETLDPTNWVAVDSNDDLEPSGKASPSALSAFVNSDLAPLLSIVEGTGITISGDPQNPTITADQGGGDMYSAIYDPQNISNDAFDLAVHTGELPPSSVNELTLTRRLSARVGGLFDTVSDLISDTTLTYSNVSEGDIIEAQGFRYEVAASGATDAHLETAGGVKLYCRLLNSKWSFTALGGVGDGVTDNLPVWEKIQTLLPAVDREDMGAIVFDPGTYYFSDTLIVTKITTLVGSGPEVAPSVIFLFPENTTGMMTTNPLMGPEYTQHASIFMSGIWFKSAGGTGDFDGLWLRSLRSRISNCFFDGFPRDGVYIAADSPAVVGSLIPGNANGFLLDHVRSMRNGRHGIGVFGDNANAGVGMLCDTIANGGYGIWEESRYGNTWVGCHSDGNTLGGWTAQEPVARPLFLGGYCEFTQPPSVFTHQRQVVLGGTHLEGIEGNYTGFNDGMLHMHRHIETRGVNSSQWGTGGNTLLLNNYNLPRSWTSGGPNSGGFYVLLTHDADILAGGNGVLSLNVAGPITNPNSSVKISFGFGRAFDAQQHFFATVESSQYQTDKYALVDLVNVDYDGKTWLALKVRSSAGDSDNAFSWWSWNFSGALYNNVPSANLGVDCMRMIQLGDGTGEAPASYLPGAMTVNRLVLTDLPTSNPGGSGIVWDDGGTLKIT